MEINGWRTYVHPLFERQLERLTRQVERLESRDPKGYASHPAAKILASINYFIREAIPGDPDRPEWRTSSYWFTARFNGRYRLFYRMSREHRIIIYVWIRNDQNLRSGPFGAFRTALERGDPKLWGG